MMAGLASNVTEQMTILIDATYLKAHRTASSLRAKKREARRPARALDRAHERWAEYQAARRDGYEGASVEDLHDRGSSQRLHWRRRPSGESARRRMDALLSGL